LVQTLAKRPKILIIHCHGENNKNNYPYFCFEDKKLPSQVKKCKLQDLEKLFKEDKSK